MLCATFVTKNVTKNKHLEEYLKKKNKRSQSLSVFSCNLSNAYTKLTMEAVPFSSVYAVPYRFITYPCNEVYFRDKFRQALTALLAHRVSGPWVNSAITLRTQQCSSRPALTEQLRRLAEKLGRGCPLSFRSCQLAELLSHGPCPHCPACAWPWTLLGWTTIISCSPLARLRPYAMVVDLPNSPCRVGHPWLLLCSSWVLWGRVPVREAAAWPALISPPARHLPSLRQNGAPNAKSSLTFW